MPLIDPQIRVSFPLSGTELAADGLRIRMSEYAHDLAILNFGRIITSPAETGAPVYVAWGTPTNPAAFFGYFDHATDKEMVCVGASYPMKDAAQKVWTDTSADQIAYEIADRYQLDGDIEADNRIWPQVAQVGESDWQLLCRLAKSVGYTCYVHQTQLRFHSRTRDFIAMQDRCPLFRGEDIFGFSPVMGTAVPDDSGTSSTQRQMTSLSSDGDVFTATDSGAEPIAGSFGYTPPFSSVSTGVVDTLSDAFSTLAAQREASRWYITADTVVRGSVQLRQGMPVYLGGLPADYTGYWYVLTAEHRVVPSSQSTRRPESSYTVALKLGRDSRGQSLQAPALDPSVKYLGINPTTGIGDVSSPRLVNGRWQSSRSVAYVPNEDEVPDFVRDRLSGLA